MGGTVTIKSRPNVGFSSVISFKAVGQENSNFAPVLAAHLASDEK
jgi:hypothetical protein